MSNLEFGEEEEGTWMSWSPNENKSIWMSSWCWTT